MANTDSTMFTGQSTSKDGTDLHADGSVQAAQEPLRTASFEFTLTGAETTAHDFRLFYATEDFYLLDDMCMVRTQSAADTDADFILEKVDSAGTVTALTGTASVDSELAADIADGGGRPFPRIITSGPVLVSKGDYVQLTVAGDTEISADEVLETRVVYRCVNHN